MRIGVVAYEIEGERSGVGRYLEGLLKGLVEIGNPWTWRLYCKGEPFDHPLWSERDETRTGGPVIEPIFDHRPNARPIAWEQTRLPFRMRKDDLDLVFSPGYSLPPLVELPSVLTLHDLSFEHLPTEFAWKERWRRRHLARLGARAASRVLADTETIADDLVRTYRLPPETVGVVPLAVERRFFASVDEAASSARLAELGVEPPYVLFVGSILPRRRLDLVLEAFARVARDGSGARHRDLQLVLAGADRLHDGSIDELIDRADLATSDRNGRVVRLPYAPEDALPALYARAAASIYVSSYEGYGLPPLESLAAGTPAVVSRGLALDDLLFDYPYRAESLDAESVTAALRHALDDPKRVQRVDAARERLRRRGWGHCAERFVAEIETALDHARR